MRRYYRVYKINKYEYAKLMQIKDTVNYCMKLADKDYRNASEDVVKYIVSVANSAKFIKKAHKKATKLYITLCRVFGIHYVCHKNLTTKEAIKNAIINDILEYVAHQISYNEDIVHEEIDRIVSMRILGKSDILYAEECE